MGLVVSGGTVIVQGRQDDELHAAVHQFDKPFVHVTDLSAFVQVGYQYQYRVLWTGDDFLAVGQGPGNVCPASQLYTEKQVYGVL